MRRFRMAILLAFGAAALASACGGSSESSTFSDTNEGGDGSGGTNGSASSGSSNSSAAGATSAQGGDGTSSPEDSAGAPGTGAGMGGESGGVFVPDPAVREGCDDWCAGALEAACNDDTAEDCLFGCRIVAGSPACNAAYGELFACAQGKTFVCDDDANPVPQGCQAQYAAAALCVLSSPDETLAEPCQAYCTSQEAADCSNSSSADDCTYACKLTSALVPTCKEDWKDFVDCAEEADVSCNEDGDPEPAGCAAPYLRYLACLVDAGQ